MNIYHRTVLMKNQAVFFIFISKSNPFKLQTSQCKTLQPEPPGEPFDHKGAPDAIHFVALQKFPVHIRHGIVEDLHADALLFIKFSGVSADSDDKKKLQRIFGDSVCSIQGLQSRPECLIIHIRIFPVIFFPSAEDCIQAVIRSDDLQSILQAFCGLYRKFMLRCKILQVCLPVF